MARGRVVDLLRDDAGLRAERQVPRIDVEDRVHVRQAEHHAARHRHAPAAQAGA